MLTEKNINIILDHYKPLNNIKLIEELKDYFYGKTFTFLSKVPLKGTPFQLKVWTETAKIPYGQTKSYADIAKSIGHEGAQRAVGSALNKNQFPIIIPCHRVIKQNGDYGYYAFGQELKANLINMERALHE